MIYAKEKFNELKKYYDSESNTVDLKKAKRYNEYLNLNLYRISNMENVNFDDSYISELICKTGGTIQAIDAYLTNICLDLIVNNSDIKISPHLNEKEFDINNTKDVDIVYSVISNLVMKNAINSCMKNLPIKEDYENSSQNISDLYSLPNQNDTKKKNSDNNLLLWSETSTVLKKSCPHSNEEKKSTFVNVKNQSNGINVTLTADHKFNEKLQQIQQVNEHNFHFINSTQLHISQSHSSKEKLQNSINKTVLSEDNINSLVNNFTKTFTYETNIFDNIKHSNFMNIFPDSTSPNNIVSLMISNIFDDGKENSYNNNFFDNKNCSYNNNNANSNPHIKERVLLSLLDYEKSDTIINNDLMEKLQSVNDFGLFKSIMEKIIVNNILNNYFENSESIINKNSNNNNNYINNQVNLGIVENFSLNHHNYKSINSVSNANNYNREKNLNSEMKDQDIQRIIRKIEKIKKDRDDSKSNAKFLQNKMHRSPSHN